MMSARRWELRTVLRLLWPPALAVATLSYALESSSAASARVPVFMFFSLIYELASAAPGTRTGYAVDLGSLALDRCHLAQVSIITYLIEDYLFRKKGKRSRIECGGNKINLS